MLIDNELSVSKIAEITGITTQSIYERLRKENNEIKKYIVPDKEPVKLYKAVLKEIYNVDVEKIERSGKDNFRKYLTSRRK